MTNILTSFAELTLGMSAVIVVLLLTLLAFGKKLTAKSRYLIWSLVIIRLAIPFSLQLLPPMFTLPSVPSTEVTIPVKPEAPSETEVNKDEKLPQNNVGAPMTDGGNLSFKEPVSTEGVAGNPVVPDEGYVPQGNVSVVPDTPAETDGVISGNVTVPDTEKPTVIPDKTEPAPETPAADNAVKIDVAAVLSAIWLAGAAAFALVSIISYARYTRRVLKTSSPAEEETVAIYERLCQELGVKKAPRLLVSNTTDSPAAFGYFRRYIALPEIPLSLNSLELTLSHELTHVKRGDLTVKLLSVLARSFHWFNPLVHYAAYRCETECELSCDEAVLLGRGDEIRTEYGETLVDILKFCRRRRGSLTTHFSPDKKAVKARLGNILYGTGKRRGIVLVALCLALCIVAGAVIGCSFGTGGGTKPATDTDTEETSGAESESTPDTESAPDTEPNTDTVETEPVPDDDTIEESSPVLTPVVWSPPSNDSYLGSWYSEIDPMYYADIKKISSNEIEFHAGLYSYLGFRDVAVKKDGVWYFEDEDEDSKYPDPSGTLALFDDSIIITYFDLGYHGKASGLEKGVHSVKLTRKTVWNHDGHSISSHIFGGKIYPCDMTLENPPILGEFELTFSHDNLDYYITDYAEYKCDGTCTDAEHCRVLMYTADHDKSDDYEPYLIEEHLQSLRGWPYATKIYANRFIGDPATTTEGAIDYNCRQYKFVIGSGGHYITLGIAPQRADLVSSEGELEAISEIAKSMLCSVDNWVEENLDGNAPVITSRIIGDGDAYITDGRHVLRDSIVTFKEWNDDYRAVLARVVLCDTACTCTENELFSALRDIVHLNKLQEYTSADGFTFPTVRYEQDASDSRNYYYNVKLANGIHLSLWIAPKDGGGAAPENEAETLADIVKSVSVTFRHGFSDGNTTRDIFKNTYTWVDDGTYDKATDNEEMTVLYKSIDGYNVSATMAKVEGKFDPAQLALVALNGHGTIYGLIAFDEIPSSSASPYADSITVLKPSLDDVLLSELENNGEYETINMLQRKYVYVIDFDGNGEYLILSVTASDTKSPPNENDRQVADKIASSAVITWYGEISYDEEWIEANREIPDELPLFEKGDMVVYTAEEAREKSPYYITALPEYRTVYYWMPYIWTNIISREEYAEWGRRVDTPHDALHAVPQEMDVVSFIKYFKIPKEDFIKACEEEAEYQQNVLKGERGYDINLEEYEIPNADILYTFDNDIINEYYRR